MATKPESVQGEIKQSRPFRSPGQEALVALLKTTDLIRREAGVRIEAEGITLQQYNVLRILRGAGRDGLPTLEIATRMIEAAPGITRLLDRLERKRLVARERCPTDRRQVTCRITKAGLAMLGRLDPVVDRSDQELLGTLDQKEIRQLTALLDRVRAGVRRRP
ncbi:MAG TPA: MarR family transcriptional regulator [Gemmatimonadales bacterium]|nr:MarR family transcriptional regulator [Gemmatimonadales bacterium]